MADEVILKIVQDVQGEDAVKRLREEEARLEQQLRGLAKALGTTDAAVLSQDAGIRQYAKDLADCRTQIQLIESASARAGMRMQGVGQGIRELGRFVQDFQAAGLMGVTNQMEGLGQAGAKVAGLTPALGALAGGIATLASVAMLIAMPAIRRLWETLTSEAADVARSRIEELEAKIRELEALGPMRLAVDTLELENARKEVDALKKAKLALDVVMGKQTQLERASGQAIEEAVVETPGGTGAVERARAGMRREFEAASEPLKENRRLRAQQQELLDHPPPGVQLDPQQRRLIAADIERLKDAAKKLVKSAHEEADEKFAGVYAAATGGKGLAQATAQEKLAEMLQGAGAKGLAGAVGEAAVPKIKAAREEEEQADVEIAADTARAERWKEARQGRDAARKEAEAGRKRAIGEAVQSFRSIGDEVVGEMASGVAEGVAPEQVRDRARAAIRARLKAGGVADALIDPVLEELYADIFKSLQGKLAAAGMGRPDVTTEQAAGKVAGESKAGKEAGRAKDEEARRIAKLARDNAKLVQGGEGASDLDIAILQGGEQGMGRKQIQERLQAEINERLRRNPEIKPEDVEAVGKGVFNEAFNRVFQEAGGTKRGALNLLRRKQQAMERRAAQPRPAAPKGKKAEGVPKVRELKPAPAPKKAKGPNRVVLPPSLQSPVRLNLPPGGLPKTTDIWRNIGMGVNRANADRGEMPGQKQAVDRAIVDELKKITKNTGQTTDQIRRGVQVRLGP